MAFILGESDQLIEYIWNQLEKSPDDHHVTYTPEDIDALWEMGFVDTEAFSLAQWRAAFDEHRRPDGSYLLGQKDFFKKDQYRYKGEIHIPFDAMLINEGLYTEEGLLELVNLSIKPSCSLSANELHQFLSQFIDSFKDPSGLIRMDKSSKLRIQEMINEAPSPLRRLEILFARMLNQLEQDIIGGNAQRTATVEQVALVQSSAFTMLPSSQSEAQAEKLKKLEHKSASTEKLPSASSEGVALKSIRRSHKGSRG